MKLTKSKLKQIIKEEISNANALTEGGLPDDYFDPAYQTQFDEDEFSEAVSEAVDQLGGERVLEIVNGVITTLEI